MNIGVLTEVEVVYQSHCLSLFDDGMDRDVRGLRYWVQSCTAVLTFDVNIQMLVKDDEDKVF